MYKSNSSYTSEKMWYSSEISGSPTNKYLVLDKDFLMMKRKDAVLFLFLESYRAVEREISLSENKTKEGTEWGFIFAVNLTGLLSFPSPKKLNK